LKIQPGLLIDESFGMKNFRNLEDLQDVYYDFIYLKTIILAKKKPAEAGFLLFWVTRHSCPGDHAARAKTSSLDALASMVFR
jgi:hypothetical protein